MGSAGETVLDLQELFSALRTLSVLLRCIFLLNYVNVVFFGVCEVTAVCLVFNL